MILAFENKVPKSYRKTFVAKVVDISNKLAIEPNWLMGIMDLETGGTFDPAITNSLGYTGLIQFGNAAAQSLGTTTTKLRKMSAVDQLDYVYKYFLPHKSKLTSYVNTYLQVLFPVAVGKPDNFVIQAKGISASKFAKANPLFHKDKNDDKVYVWEVKKALLERLPSEWINDGTLPLFVKSYQKELAIGVVLIGIGIGTLTYLKYKK